MMPEEIWSLTQRAFEANAVPALLRGEAPYAITPGKEIPAAVPTDWNRLVSLGLVPWCKADPSGGRWQQLLAGIQTLIAGTDVDLWSAYHIYFALQAEEKESGPNLAADQFPSRALRTALLAHRDSLAANRQWSGVRGKEGLWEDIYRADRGLQAYTGKGLLQ